MVTTKEPQDDIVDFLRDMIATGLMADYNSTARIGTQFIYPDQPRITDLKKNSYPRVSVEPVVESGNVAGCHSDDMLMRVLLQLTVWTKKGLIGNNSKEGQAMTDQIIRDIQSVLRQKWRTHVNLSDYWDIRIGSIRRPTYDDDLGIFRTEMEIELLTVNSGEE